MALIAITATGYLTAYQWHRGLTTNTNRPPKNFIAQVDPTSDPSQGQANGTESGTVLGTSDGSLNFVSNQNSWSNGGLIVLSASKNPEITVSSYRASGKGQFKLYQVTRDDLVNYLIYKRDTNSNYGSDIKKVYQLDRTKLTLQTSFEHDIVYSNDNQAANTFSLPLTGTGVWFLEGQVGDTQVETMLIRSHLGAIVHQGDNQNIFWVQDSNFTSVPDAKIQLLNVENTISSLGEFVTDNSGIATATANGALDFALVTKGDDFTLIPVNLGNLNFRLSSSNRFSGTFAQQLVGTKSFMFTDRFLYQPGETAYFKAIIRNNDDTDYSISPRTVTVSMGDFDKPFWQKSLAVSDLGTIDGSIPIPSDAKASEFEIRIKEGDEYVASTIIQVAQFRKPDAQVTVSTDQLLYLPGQTFTSRITGENFLGQPIRNQSVRYKIYQTRASLSGDYLSLQFPQRLEGFRPDSPGPILEGTVQLDNTGSAEVSLPVKNTTGYRQFWTMHIEYLDAAGTATNDAMQVLIQPGNFVIERVDTNQRYFMGKAAAFPIKLSKNKPDAKINQVKIQGKLFRNDGTKIVEQDNLQTITDSNGKANIAITPQQKSSYELALTATDDAGNLIKDEESFYADAPNSETSGGADLLPIFTIKTDKESYTFGETAKVTIQTKPEIKHIFTSVGRNYSRGYQVVALTNGSTSFDLPILEKYQPNVFVYAGSFVGDSWKFEQVKVSVKTADKKVTIQIAPSQKSYSPAETASFDITATDGLGRPVKTDLAFWIFDKALLELHGSYFNGIFRQFWDESWSSIATNFSFQGITSSNAERGGGCFVGDTLVNTVDGKSKRIADIKAGDLITTYASLDSKELVTAKVVTTHTLTVDGYLVINGTLKVTPEHKLLVNGQWKTAGEIAVGDQLLTDQKTATTVTSLEWVRGKVPVYNLHIEKFHTFFANGIYVHNDKGGIRSVFKNTAYWNPHVQTDETGKARITVVLPDNLTTWVAAGVAANAATQVGDGQTEFKVTKDIVVRPIFPQFLRVGDKVTLTSLVHNFTTTPEKFNTQVTFPAGEVSNGDQTVQVPAQDLIEIGWPVKVTQPMANAVFQVKAQSTLHPAQKDEVKEKLPVYEYGTWLNNYQQLQGAGRLSLQASTGTDPTRAQAILTLKASRYPQLKALLATLLSRSNSGSAESASGALIAASLINEHGEALGLNYSSATLTKVVQESTAVLKNTQDKNHLWMAQEGVVDTDRTRFAIEALVTAQRAGFTIDQNFLDQTVTAFTVNDFRSMSYQVNQEYIFSVLNRPSDTKLRMELEGQTDVSGIARTVLGNSKKALGSAGDKTSLLNLGHENDVSAWWQYSPELQPPQWRHISLPTAWAAAALLQLDSDPTKVMKALDYLYRNEDGDPEILALKAAATIQYELKTSQLAPNYTYRVSVNGQVKQTGTVTQSLQELPELKLTAEAFAPGAEIQIEQTGPGQLFSQLATTEFFTDRQLAAQSHHLSLTRKYLSTKNPGEPTKPGDLVIVQFEVKGLGGGEQAIEIEDYLPSGLVAIDQTLDNGNFDTNGKDSSYTSQEITPQGMKLTFSRLFSDTGMYSYKTRVVSAGVFDAPPAVVKLTNEPSIWASTPADKLTIDGKNALEVSAPSNLEATATTGNKLALANKLLLIIDGILIGIGLLVGFLLIFRRQQVNQFIQKLRHKQDAPPPLPPVPPQPPYSEPPLT